MSWPIKKFEELATKDRHAIVGGPFGSKLTGKDYVNEGVPVIRGANMSSGRYLGLSDFVFVSEEKKTKDLRSNLAAPLDLIFTQRGTLGQVAIVPEDTEYSEFVISQSQMKATLDPERADRDFYYYYFSSKEVVGRILNMTSSSGVPHINLGALKNFEVPVPPLDVQKRIALALTGYDDLIENNRRRIALLEEAARLLYREWFVHFRFPGHEHVKINGGVPKNWTETTPKKFFKGHIGGGWGKDDPEGQHTTEVHVIRGTDIPNLEYGGQGGAGVRFEKESTLRSRLLNVGDVIFEVSGGSSTQPIARTLLVTSDFLKRFDHPVICASFCKRLSFSSDSEALFFHYHTLESRENGQILQYQKESASSLKNFNFKGFLETYKILIPSNILIEMFFEEVRLLVRQKEFIAQSTFQLARARDLIIPRLMDGRLEI